MLQGVCVGGEGVSMNVCTVIIDHSDYSPIVFRIVATRIGAFLEMISGKEKQVWIAILLRSGI